MGEISMGRSRKALPRVVTGLLVAASAYAQDKDTAWDNPSWGDPWQFRVNLYGWLPDAPAKISVGDTTVVDVPEDLDTVLDSLNFAAMFELEAHKGPLALFANVIYYDGDYSDTLPGPISNQQREYKLEEEVWAIKYGVGYRFGSWDLGENQDSPTMTITPWVGAWYFHDDYAVTIQPTGTLSGGSVEGTFKFNTPMVGVTPRIRFNDRWYLNSSFSYGGWDVDDVDEIYDLFLNAGYRFKMGKVPAQAFFGYRYMHFDWIKEPEKIDLTVKGPYIGIGWIF